MVNFVSASSTYVAAQGIMRRCDSEKVVCVFETNYVLPFAYWNWRTALIVNQSAKGLSKRTQQSW